MNVERVDTVTVCNGVVDDDPQLVTVQGRYRSHGGATVNSPMRDAAYRWTFAVPEAQVGGVPVCLRAAGLWEDLRLIFLGVNVARFVARPIE